jgi:hypothetical protein
VFAVSIGYLINEVQKKGERKMAYLLNNNPVNSWKLATLAKVEVTVTYDYINDAGGNTEVFMAAAGNIAPLLNWLLERAVDAEEFATLAELAAGNVTVESKRYGLVLHN